jgi:hypothetical protein
MPHCCECYLTAPWAREDDNNGRGFPSYTWYAWDLVRDWAMAGRPATPRIHRTNSSLRRHVDMLFQHPPQVRTVCSYSPWLNESQSISILLEELRWCMAKPTEEDFPVSQTSGIFKCAITIWSLVQTRKFFFIRWSYPQNLYYAIDTLTAGNMYFGLYIQFILVLLC